MFQAIVHAPGLRPGARLCLSDLRQTLAAPPLRPAVGDPVALRFGVCCPALATGAVAAIVEGAIVLRIAGAGWRLGRCPNGGGVDVPGLVAEDWFVLARETGQ